MEQTERETMTQDLEIALDKSSDDHDGNSDNGDDDDTKRDGCVSVNHNDNLDADGVRHTTCATQVTMNDGGKKDRELEQDDMAVSETAVARSGMDDKSCRSENNAVPEPMSEPDTPPSTPSQNPLHLGIGRKEPGLEDFLSKEHDHGVLDSLTTDQGPNIVNENEPISVEDAVAEPLVECVTGFVCNEDSAHDGDLDRSVRFVAPSDDSTSSDHALGCASQDIPLVEQTGTCNLPHHEKEGEEDRPRTVDEEENDGNDDHFGRHPSSEEFDGEPASLSLAHRLDELDRIVNRQGDNKNSSNARSSLWKTYRQTIGLRRRSWTEAMAVTPNPHREETTALSTWDLVTQDRLAAWQQHLDVAVQQLLDRLFTYLSSLPTVVACHKASTLMNPTSESSCGPDVSHRDPTTTTAARGLTLPASAIAWLSWQLLSFPTSSMDPSLRHDQRPDRDPLASSSSSMLLSPSLQHRLSLIKFLLPRVTHLRISADLWPPRPKMTVKATTATTVIRATEGLPSSTNNAMACSLDDQPQRDDAHAVLHLLERIMLHPHVDMRLFPNCQVLWVDHLSCPRSMAYLLSTLQTAYVRQSLQVLRLEGASLPCLPVALIRPPLSISKSSNRATGQEHEQHDPLSFFESGRERGISRLPSPSSVPQRWNTFSQLTHVKLSYCGLDETSGLQGWNEQQGKTAFDQRRPRPIPGSPPPLSTMTQLRSIILSHNALQTQESALAGLSHLPWLHTLDLSYNCLRSMSKAHLMIGNLQTLLLRRNQLDNVQGLDRLLSLQVLDLRDNRLADLAAVARLARLPQLQQLSLRGNPFCYVMAAALTAATGSAAAATTASTTNPNHNNNNSNRGFVGMGSESNLSLALAAQTHNVRHRAITAAVVATDAATLSKTVYCVPLWELFARMRLSESSIGNNNNSGNLLLDTYQAVLPQLDGRRISLSEVKRLQHRAYTSTLVTTIRSSTAACPNKVETGIEQPVQGNDANADVLGPVRLPTETNLRRQRRRHCARIVDQSTSSTEMRFQAKHVLETRRGATLSLPLVSTSSIIPPPDDNVDDGAVIKKEAGLQQSLSLFPPLLFTLDDVLESLAPSPFPTNAPLPSSIQQEDEEHMDEQEDETPGATGKADPPVEEELEDEVVPINGGTLLLSDEDIARDADSMDRLPPCEKTEEPATKTSPIIDLKLGSMEKDGTDHGEAMAFQDKSDRVTETADIQDEQPSLPQGVENTVRPVVALKKCGPENLIDSSAQSSTSSDDHILPPTIQAREDEFNQLGPIHGADAKPEANSEEPAGAALASTPHQPVSVASVIHGSTNVNDTTVDSSTTDFDRDIHGQRRIPASSQASILSESLSVSRSLGLRGEQMWHDDNMSVPSTIETTNHDDTSTMKRFQLYEERSSFEGPMTLKALSVRENLELYFRLFVFSQHCRQEAIDPPPAAAPGADEEVSSFFIHHPRIQLWPVDRPRQEDRTSTSQIPVNIDMPREEFRRVWNERVVACGKNAFQRLSPIRVARYGFHGELLWPAGNSSNLQPETVIEHRDVILCCSNAAFYIVADRDAASSKGIDAQRRKFPLPIPEKAVFEDAKWPHALARHDLETLSSIVIGFGFQRLTLRFSKSVEPGPEDFVYVLLTSNKLETVALLKELQDLAIEVRSVVSAAPLLLFQMMSPSSATDGTPIAIENDDRHFLDALAVALAPDVIEVVLHYQVLQQRWRRGERGNVRRACVVTNSKLYLLDEDYVGDSASGSIMEGGAESSTSLSGVSFGNRRLGDTEYRLVDSAELRLVSKVQAADRDPRALTIVIRPSSRLQRTHNWRLVCRDRHGAERLVDDVRKAINMM